MTLKRTTWMWAALAVAGLVVAAGVSYAASQLTKPSVGLTNEPVSAGARLTPRTTQIVPAKPKRHRHPGHQQPTAAAPPAGAPAPAPTPAPAAPAPASPAPAAPSHTQTTPQHHDDSSGSDDSHHGGSGHDD